MLRVWFPKPHKPTSAGFRLCFCCPPLLALTETERAGPCRVRLWLKGIVRLIWVIQTVKLSPPTAVIMLFHFLDIPVFTGSRTSNLLMFTPWANGWCKRPIFLTYLTFQFTPSSQSLIISSFFDLKVSNVSFPFHWTLEATVGLLTGLLSTSCLRD